MIYGTLYRLIMKLAHKYNWHYAPPIYPDGDTQLWCQWCGFREVVQRKGEETAKAEDMPNDMGTGLAIPRGGRKFVR